MKTVVFTSAAINYLPKVRKLCASIRQHHPEWEIVLALADRDGGAVDFSVEPIDEVLPIDHVYAGPGWRTVSVQRGPKLGSDHYPVIVTLAPST